MMARPDQTDHAAPLAQAVPEAASDVNMAEKSSILSVLPPQLLSSVLQRLWDCPQALLAFSLASTQAHNVVTDVWADLCRQLTSSFPQQLRSVDWSPSAWGVGSHRELYVRLLHPYHPLLQQRVWHTTKMPAGQLLVVDAEPPCLVGRSLHFTGLNGEVYGHPVFVVRLPPEGKGKALVCCSQCRPICKQVQAGPLHSTLAATAAAVAAELGFIAFEANFLGQFSSSERAYLDAINGNRAGHECTDQLCSASLQFMHPAAVPAAAHLARLDGLVAAAAASGAEPGKSAAAGSGPGSGSSCATDSSSSSQRASAGFSLRCAVACGGLYAEEINRLAASRPYSHVSAGRSESSEAAGGAEAPCPSTAATGSRLLLPGIKPGRSPGAAYATHAALTSPSEREKFCVAEQQKLRRYFRWDAPWLTQATYQPLTSSPWLHPAGANATNADALTTPTAAGAAETAAGSAAVAAAGLMGLWVGVYPNSSAQLVQLQLFAAPPGYMLQQEYPVLEPPKDSKSCPKGVLLRSVLHTPAPERPPHSSHSPGHSHSAATQLSAEPQAAAATSGNASRAGTSAAGATSRADNVSDSTSLGMHEDMEGRQLLLVGIKVTGDRTVPAGQVSFAVDLGSRSTSGAGQLLHQHLPEREVRRSPLMLGEPGTRPLIIKERYAGLAQIANPEPKHCYAFESPRVTQVELLVLQDPDCLALWWKAPINSVSLLSRLDELP